MIRALHRPLALAATVVIAAPSLAQGIWPDAPWSDSRSIRDSSLHRSGRAVAFAGGTVVASGYERTAPENGAFATFRRGASGYELRQFFPDPAPNPTGGFGMRIAANATMIAVADPGYPHDLDHVTLSDSPDRPNDSGRVEIYWRPTPSADFAFAHTLENPTGKDPSGFGLSMAVAGDFLLVGAPFATVFGVPQVGAVFLYERRFSPREYVRIATFIPPAVEPYTHFGWSVAVSQDDNVFIGWPNSNDRTGRVLQYTRQVAGPWKLAKTFSPNDLQLPTGVSVREFGASVATMPDDGGVLAIGAPATRDQTNNQSRPMVFIYETEFFGGQPFELTDVIERPIVFGGQRFGDAVSLNDDYFADRILAIGSGNRVFGGGAVNVYTNRRFTPGWTNVAQLRNVNAGALAVHPSNMPNGWLLASGNSGVSAFFYSEAAQCFPDLRGDANNDGVTNFEDLNAILADFGLEGENLDTDLNDDGVVDDVDLTILLFTFGSPCLPPNY